MSGDGTSKLALEHWVQNTDPDPELPPMTSRQRRVRYMQEKALKADLLARHAGQEGVHIRSPMEASEMISEKVEMFKMDLIESVQSNDDLEGLDKLLDDHPDMLDDPDALVYIIACYRHVYGICTPDAVGKFYEDIDWDVHPSLKDYDVSGSDIQTEIQGALREVESHMGVAKSSNKEVKDKETVEFDKAVDAYLASTPQLNEDAYPVDRSQNRARTRRRAAVYTNDAVLTHGGMGKGSIVAVQAVLGLVTLVMAVAHT
jgi:hypothetical protein